MGVDVLIDGTLLGLAFVAGQKAGLLLTIGLASKCFPSAWQPVRPAESTSGPSPKASPRWPGSDLALVVGAAVAVLLLQGLTGAALAAVLAFGVAALFYLMTEELFVEAREVRENTATTAMFSRALWSCS